MREVTHKILQFACYRRRVVALFLQLVDLVLKSPLLLLQSGLFFRELFDLGVDEANCLRD